jgi:hypothetical protein
MIGLPLECSVMVSVPPVVVMRVLLPQCLGSYPSSISRFVGVWQIPTFHAVGYFVRNEVPCKTDIDQPFPTNFDL